jgi:hypothetical protein
VCCLDLEPRTYSFQSQRWQLLPDSS